MPKVLISGYYGYDNLGDELILKAIIDSLQNADPGLEIAVISGNPQRTTSLHPSVKAVSRRNIPGILNALRKCQLFISGGGGLLQDTTGQGSVLYYLGWGIIAKKIFGKKVMLYAQGIGPLYNGLSRSFISAWISKMDLITLREENSRRLLEDLQVFGANIRVTADPVLSLKPKTASDVKGRHPLRIGVVLRQDRDKLRAAAPWSAILTSIKDTYNARILLLPFQAPDDVRLSYAIRENMKNQSDIVCWRKLEDVFTAYDNIDLLISMRLHALILAAVYGKPMIGISYDPKIDNFLILLGQKAINRDQVSKTIETLVLKKEDIVAGQNNVLPQLKARSMENARLAMELLKESIT